MKMKFATILLLAGLAVSCTSISEITPIGKDTYMMASSSNAMGAGGGNLKAKLVKNASIYCIKQNKLLMLVDSTSADMAFGRTGSAEISFRCLNEDDPEYVRPNIKYGDHENATPATGVLLQLN